MFSAFLLLVQVQSSQYYDTSSASTYHWTRTYPQSCACREDGATKFNCKYFSCSCACDVTANVCDYNCCCDPDCSDNAISRFEALDACSFEGNAADSYPVCYSSLDLERVNPRGSELGGQSTAQEAVGSALCVEVKNTAHKGFYYTTVDLQDSAIFTTSNGQKDYDYSIDSITTLTPDTYYDQNDTIPAYYIDSTVYYPGSNNGLFSIPVSNNLDGTCVDNYVKFEVSTTEPSQCTRRFSDAATFEAMCASEMSLDNYVNNLYLAKSADSTDYSTVSAGDVADVVISAVYFVDYLTGIQTDVTTSWTTNSCDTDLETGLTYAALTTCAYSSDLQTTPYNSASYDICRGMVLGVTYSIVHDSANTFNISSVTAVVYISDVPYITSDDTVVTQYFEVGFSSVDTYDSKSTSTNGNEVTRARSGNPGYLQGKPVLYGYDSSGINELITGLTIPSSLTSYDDSASSLFGTSTCPVSTTTVDMQVVQFGYDTQSGCTVSITREELKAMCCQGSSTGCTSSVSSDYVGTVDGTPYIFNGPLSETDAVVGYYGNADPLDSDQWFSFEVGAWTDTRVWVEDTGTCQNMPSSLVYNFLVAKTGEKANPQNKIVAAASSIETSNWVWRLPHDSTLTQTFQFTITTTFVYTDKNQLTGYLPPAPPVLFEVPYDVFYPFLSSSASSRSALNAVLAVSSIIVTMLIIV